MDVVGGVGGSVACLCGMFVVEIVGRELLFAEFLLLPETPRTPAVPGNTMRQSSVSEGIPCIAAHVALFFLTQIGQKSNRNKYAVQILAEVEQMHLQLAFAGVRFGTCPQIRDCRIRFAPYVHSSHEASGAGATKKSRIEIGRRETESSPQSATSLHMSVNRKRSSQERVCLLDAPGLQVRANPSRGNRIAIAVGLGGTNPHRKSKRLSEVLQQVGISLTSASETEPLSDADSARVQPVCQNMGCEVRRRGRGECLVEPERQNCVRAPFAQPGDFSLCGRQQERLRFRLKEASCMRTKRNHQHKASISACLCNESLVPEVRTVEIADEDSCSFTAFRQGSDLGVEQWLRLAQWGSPQSGCLRALKEVETEARAGLEPAYEDLQSSG